MDPLDYLERRIEVLELQILPKNQIFTYNDKTQQVTDLLLQTQTMISSALSCREAITSILQHMNTINEYLDPYNEGNEKEVNAKRFYLLELLPELKETLKVASTFENLVPYSNSESILKVNELSDKLETLAVFNLELFKESKEVTDKTVSALQQYNDIISSLKVLFSQLDQSITALEVASLPKVAVDD